MIFYCIRHGQTLFNAAGKIQGQLDTPLSPLGIQQCQATAQALRGEPIDAVYSSPLRRAYEMALCIADSLGLPVQKEDRLMEIHAGIFQGKDWNEIAEQYPDDSVRWKAQDPDFRIPGGESRRDLMHRGQAAFAAIREQNFKQVLVVSHGGLLSAALKALLDIPAERNPFSLFNGSINKLEWKSEIKLLTLNECRHLDGLAGNGGEL
jgi:2,3-bisphosphoglycerate-dependent phosphoglycerate mutase